MEANRDLKELLILLKYYIIRQKPDIFYGMCGEIYEMYSIGYLENTEISILIKFLEVNRPKGLEERNYWFPKGEKQPRIDWLNEQIYKL